jgi:hypothetical protein
MSHSRIDKLTVAYKLPHFLEIADSVLYSQDPHESTVQQEYIHFQLIVDEIA